MACKNIFTFHNHLNKLRREQKWFQNWLLEGYSLRQLHNISGHSIRTHKRINAYWLALTPPSLKLSFANFKYLISDGTYFHHENCIYTIIDALSGLILSYQFERAENYALAREAFSTLKKAGCEPTAITLDGNKPVLKALQDVWPNIIVQRCLYHILRQGTSWLRRFPKDPAARALRDIILTVTTISDLTLKELFLKHFVLWEQTYGTYTQSLDGHHKVWSDLQKARSLIINALPNMFHYLDDPKIAFTSNKQEGLFSIVKILFRNHRGVKKANRENYFRWYFYFKNKKNTNYFGP